MSSDEENKSSSSSTYDLPKLKPEPFPSFPTVFELAQVQETPTEYDRGLFQALFAGRHEALLSDALDNPDKYPAEVVSLLHDLHASRRAPTPVERDALNRASALFFNKPDAPKPETPVRFSTTSTRQAPTPVPTQEPPVMDAFWWT